VEIITRRPIKKLLLIFQDKNTTCL